MPGMYAQFKTDERFESEGIWLEFDTFRVKMARAGGGNKRFARTLETLTKPYRRAIRMEEMSNDRSLALLREAYASSIILNWEVKQDGEWVKGIEASDGSLLSFTKENVIETLTNLPDLFQYIMDEATKMSLFREEVREEEAGNL